jgi:hypothetical protein
MGWTNDREVQCGCGWEGHSLESTRAYKAVAHPAFPEPIVVALMYLCPMCHADVTSQATREGFKITYHSPDWNPTGKVFRDDYYETRALNDGLD